jgi:hypothetical protein
MNLYVGRDERPSRIRGSGDGFRSYLRRSFRSEDVLAKLPKHPSCGLILSDYGAVWKHVCPFVPQRLLGRVYKPGATSEIEDSPRLKRRRLPLR